MSAAKQWDGRQFAIRYCAGSRLMHAWAGVSWTCNIYFTLNRIDPLLIRRLITILLPQALIA